MANLGFTPASGQDVFSIETSEQSSSTITSALIGKEARDFYENLMKDDKVQNVSIGAVNHKDYGREHLNKQKNRESGRRGRRRVRAAEMQLGETDSVVQGRINVESEGNQRRETSNSERSVELMGLRLLRCAHEGDIAGLKDLIAKGVDINFQVKHFLLGVFILQNILFVFTDYLPPQDTYFWTAMMCASWSGQRAAVRLLLQHGAAWVGVVDTQGRDVKDLALEGITA